MNISTIATYFNIALPILVMIFSYVIEKSIQFKVIFPFIVFIIAWLLGVRVLNKVFEFSILYLSIIAVAIYFIKRPISNKKIATLSTVLISWFIVIILFLVLFNVQFIKPLIFLFTYPGLICIGIFFYKRIPKLKNTIITIVIIIHTSFSMFIGIGNWNGYFSEQTIKPLSQNKFLIFKVKGALLHSNLNCTLAKTIFGKYVYFEAATNSFYSGNVDDAFVEEDYENDQIRVRIDGKTEVFEW